MLTEVLSPTLPKAVRYTTTAGWKWRICSSSKQAGAERKLLGRRKELCDEGKWGPGRGLLIDVQWNQPHPFYCQDASLFIMVSSSSCQPLCFINRVNYLAVLNKLLADSMFWLLLIWYKEGLATEITERSGSHHPSHDRVINGTALTFSS